MASKLSVAVSGGRDRNSTPAWIGGLGRRAVPPALAAIAVAGLLAACGSAGAGGGYGAGGSSGAGGGSGAGGTHGTTAHGGMVISVRKLPGIGTVLADRSGKTLYSAQQEADGTIMCTGGCLSFWFPVRVAAGAALRAPSGVTGALGTIHRPGGLSQLTYNGKPLYTFRLDQAPGQAHGNDFTDHFGGTAFTWHALTTNGTPAQTGGQGNSGGSSYQSGTPGY